MPRTVAVYTNAFGPYGVDAAVAGARECGFDRLELALKPHDFGGLVIPESAVVTPESPEDRVRSFVASLTDHAVSVSGCNIGGGDLRTEPGFLATERRLRFASRWFRPSRAVTGVGQPASSTERSAVVTNLRRLGDIASGLEIVIALETHQGPTQNARAMLELMAEVGHPAVRINFDTGNIAYYNDGLDPAGELRQVAPWVANVHLKDNRGRFQDWHFPPWGTAGRSISPRFAQSLTTWVLPAPTPSRSRASAASRSRGSSCEARGSVAAWRTSGPAAISSDDPSPRHFVARISFALIVYACQSERKYARTRIGSALSPISASV